MGVLPPDLMVDARTAVRVACGLFFLPHTIAKLRRIKFQQKMLFEHPAMEPDPTHPPLPVKQADGHHTSSHSTAPAQAGYRSGYS
jgi:hypothetical protein